MENHGKIAPSISVNPEIVTRQKFEVLASRFDGFEREVLLSKNLRFRPSGGR